jgi:hypothetical protein
MTSLDRHRGETEVQLQSIRNPALEGVGCSAPRPGRFTSGKATLRTVHGSGWASGPVWTARKISPPPAFDPRTVHLYGLRYPGRVYLYIVNKSNSKFLKVGWNDHDTNNSRCVQGC